MDIVKKIEQETLIVQQCTLKSEEYLGKLQTLIDLQKGQKFCVSNESPIQNTFTDVLWRKFYYFESRKDLHEYVPSLINECLEHITVLYGKKSEFTQIKLDNAFDNDIIAIFNKIDTVLKHLLTWYAETYTINEYKNSEEWEKDFSCFTKLIQELQSEYIVRFTSVYDKEFQNVKQTNIQHSNMVLEVKETTPVSILKTDSSMTENIPASITINENGGIIINHIQSEPESKPSSIIENGILIPKEQFFNDMKKKNPVTCSKRIPTNNLPSHKNPCE